MKPTISLHKSQASEDCCVCVYVCMCAYIKRLKNGKLPLDLGTTGIHKHNKNRGG